MAFHVLSSELKWLLITFIIGLQEGPKRPTCWLIPLSSFLSLILVLGYQARYVHPEELTDNFQSRKQEINDNVMKVQLLEVTSKVGLLDSRTGGGEGLIRELTEL